MKRYTKILIFLFVIAILLLTLYSNKDLENKIAKLNIKIEILEQEKRDLKENMLEINGELENSQNLNSMELQEKNKMLKFINLFFSSFDNEYSFLEYTYEFEYKKLNQRYSIIIHEGDAPFGFCKLYDNVTNEMKKIDIPKSDNNSLATASITDENPDQIVFSSNGKNPGWVYGFSRKFIYNINTEEINIINTYLNNTSYYNRKLGLYTNEMEFNEVIVNKNSFVINFKENTNTQDIGPINYPSIYISTEKTENQKGYISFIFQNVLLQKDTAQKFEKLKQLTHIKDIEVSVYDDGIKTKGTKVCIYLNDGVKYYGDFIDIYNPQLNIIFN